MTSLSRAGSGQRHGRRDLARLRRQLSPRDHAVLAMLDAHRYLTSRQLQAFCFTDHATPTGAARVCNRVLARLHAQDLLARLERRVGGVRAGSASYVWTLAPAGHHLVHPAATRRRRREPTTTFLDHGLAVADTHLRLLDHAAAQGQELLRIQTEPTCWRDYTGPGGGRETLKPDLYAVLADEQYEDHYFIEVDQGTESLPRLVAKCRQYETYRRHRDDSQAFPLVVWLLPEESRIARLQAELARDPMVDARLFRVGSLERLHELLVPDAGGSA